MAVADERFVYGFSEDSENLLALCGGKGAGLMRMRRLGLPVPEGFVKTTEACASYTSSGELPRGLMDEVREHPARLEDATGRGCGDPANPLLVSVRSGAPISMPGLEERNPMLGLRGCRLGLLRPEV
jgi:pyruvate, orthophosphate dikinase